MLEWRISKPTLPPAIVIAGATVFLFLTVTAFPLAAQSIRDLPPLELQIQKQQERLNSGNDEERRDALMQLAAMRRAAASRAALPALSDPSPMIRVMAARAILSLEPAESVAALLPLLNDKDEFVRREGSYALGATRSKTATTALSDRLLNDKEAGVRSAAAVALGQIGDEAGVIALVGVVAPQLSAPAQGKRKRENNEFVLRAAAVSLGQIRSRSGVPALIAVVNDEKLPVDVRREAVRSLGLIGDPGAIPTLKTASLSEDPFLSQLAYESLRKVSH
jgi:HEAT repeat protein